MRPDAFKQPHTEFQPLRGSGWPSGPPRLVLRLAVLAVVASLGFAGWRAWGPTGGGWYKDLEKGFAAGAEAGKPVLVLHTSNRWPQCQKLNREVLSDPQIEAYLKQKYVLVKIDLTRPYGPHNRLAAEANVTDLPTAIVYRAKGRELKRVVGGKQVGAWLRSQARRKQPRLELK